MAQRDEPGGSMRCSEGQVVDDAGRVVGHGVSPHGVAATVQLVRMVPGLVTIKAHARGPHSTSQQVGPMVMRER